MLRAHFAIALLLATFLSSCISNPKPTWQVKTGTRATLAFSGKGSAAGIMMGPYMGGAGVAIGIAIDEGIGKTIGENLQKKYPDFSIVSLVEQQLANKYRRSPALVCSKGAAQVIVETYGFHTFSGYGDNLTAWLKMRFVCSGKETVISYPADFPAPKLAEFHDVKSNADIAYNLLNDAVVEVVQVWQPGMKP